MQVTGPEQFLGRLQVLLDLWLQPPEQTSLTDKQSQHWAVASRWQHHYERSSEQSVDLHLNSYYVIFVDYVIGVDFFYYFMIIQLSVHLEWLLGEPVPQTERTHTHTHLHQWSCGQWAVWLPGSADAEAGQLQGHSQHRDSHRRRLSNQCLKNIERGKNRENQLRLTVIWLTGSDTNLDTHRKTEVKPTRRIEQDDVLPSVDAAFLSERCSDLLRSLVELNTSGCAHCYPLKGRK